MHRVYAKYGVDFIKQDGEWKIWHFRCFEVVREPYGMGWIPWAGVADAEGFNSDLMYIGDDGRPVFLRVRPREHRALYRGAQGS
jgi:hypothetical protein